ncbi:RNA polymerase factor sigma-54 [Anaerosphaera multitolerans]|uniref:RNA polymerase sigma-54 factor n=1 Tax=Anaerosphaera multitolerans TaxID=2487351 RepID=A0A437S995_9FIRM|nr:RNA polymerase factor sigma-54 [Anaerosphaera multitolerans]RVU55683.1 RNA polymerase sigma-54 factor [Anaerosphaera multitolerans]
MDLNIKLNQVQQLNLTTQLIQAIEIIELNSMELEDFLMKESEENIFVDYQGEVERKKTVEFLKRRGEKKEDYYGVPDEEESSYERYISSKVLLRDVLMEQLDALKLTKAEKKIGEFLVDNIDSSGYLKIDLNEASDILNVDTHDVFYILKKIWQFEPRGIGARDLRECLLLQIEDGDDVLKGIIEYHLEDISENRINKIAKNLNISIEETLENIEKIKKLNPKPGSGFDTSQEPTVYIRPEVFVEVEGEELTLSFEGEGSSNIAVNEYYLKMLERDIDDETKKYLNDKFSRTMFLINSIEQRMENIRKVSKEIVERQRDFFLYGSPLKPMTLKDVAEALGISESTVSRVTKNKYLQSNKGIFPMKYFFSTSISASGGSVSKDYIEKLLIDIIENEDKLKPLSDQKITDIINKKGIDINRRTIAKYRSELGIGSAKNRRSFNGK